MVVEARERMLAVSGCGGNSTGESLSVFHMPINIDVPLLSLILISLIILTLIFESVLHYLNHFVNKTQKKMLEKVKDELMVLGFISFSITLLEQSGAIHLEHDVLLVFEFAHMLIFFVACTILAFTTNLIKMDTRMYRRWRDFEMTPYYLQQGIGHEKVLKSLQNEETSFLKRVAAKVGIVTELRDGAEYHIFRTIFFEKYSIPEVFNFPDYLHECLVANITTVLDVSMNCWLTIIVLILINVVRYYIVDYVFPDYDLSYDVFLFALCGESLMVFDIVILTYGRKALMKFLFQYIEDDQSKDLPNALDSALVLRNKTRTTIDFSTLVVKSPCKPSKSSSTKRQNHDNSPPSNQVSADPDTIFPFNNSALFVFCVRLMVVLHCFDTALVLMLYIDRVTRMPSEETALAVVCMLGMFIPILYYVLVLSTKTLVAWSMLKALSLQDMDLVESVVESSIAERTEYDQLRAVFMMHFEFHSNLNVRKHRKKLLEIFKQYDKDGDNSLNFKEFTDFCTVVCGRNLSKNRIASFIRVIIRDQRTREEFDIEDNRIKSSYSYLTKNRKLTDETSNTIISFEGFRRFVIGFEGLEQEEHEDEKEQEKEQFEMRPYHKKALVYAFRTKDEATFKKTWGESKAFANDYVLVSGTADEGEDTHDIYAISALEFGNNYEPIVESTITHQSTTTNILSPKSLLSVNTSASPSDSPDVSKVKYRKKGIVFAQCMTQKFDIAVKTVNNDGDEEKDNVIMLAGQPGDFIVRPIGKSPYIISRDKFLSLYAPANNNDSSSRMFHALHKNLQIHKAVSVLKDNDATPTNLPQAIPEEGRSDSFFNPNNRVHPI